MKSKNEWLATAVMGWEFDSTWGRRGWYGPNDTHQAAYEDSWNPAEDLRQAFQLLETTDFTLRRIEGVYGLTTLGNINNLIPENISGTHLPTVITEACLKASGYYNE